MIVQAGLYLSQAMAPLLVLELSIMMIMAISLDMSECLPGMIFLLPGLSV